MATRTSYVLNSFKKTVGPVKNYDNFNGVHLIIFSLFLFYFPLS